MFNRIRLRIKDMKTLSKLITGADKQANLLGEEKPGAEHFLLSALALPDGSAKRVFDRLGVDPESFRIAIAKQYSEALDSVGVNSSIVEETPEPIETPAKFPNSKPSGQALMKSLHRTKQKDKDRPLLGIHVLSVIADMEHGVSARAFRVLGIESVQLSQAVKDEIHAMYP